ncbi:hypothetical protein BSKO_13837 [Bryopsis sp. KO-2023]|nr:hypothetical protein BSKO_13837 [Bryopsis sp. KO-2023]
MKLVRSCKALQVGLTLKTRSEPPRDVVLKSQAAEAEDAGAMSHLGHMYANGLGVEQNNKTALKWFEKGAGEGHPNGHYGLG